MKRRLLLLASSVFGIISGCECRDPDGRDTYWGVDDYTAWVPDSDESSDWDDDGWTVNEGDCDDSDP